jgi:hypothetical protein
MWMWLLVAVALVLGLGSRWSAARERWVVLGCAVLAIGYVAASKHLL